MTQYKTCVQCGQIKSLCEFIEVSDKRTNKKYLQKKCRICVNERLRQWQRANKEKVALYARNYRAKYPEKSQANSQQAIQNRKSRPKAPKPAPTDQEMLQRAFEKAARLEAKRQIKKQDDKTCNRCKVSLPRQLFNADKSRWDGLQTKCKGCTRSESAKWIASNPEKASEARSRRRALLLNADNRQIKDKEIKRLLLEPCLYCGAPSEHIDHIVPLSRGGRHSIGNLTGACKSCNLSKGAKFITEWKRGKIGH